MVAKKQSKESITWIRIPEKDRQKLETIAAEKQVSLAAVIRWAIQEYLKGR